MNKILNIKIIGGIPDLLKKSSKQEIIHISGQNISGQKTFPKNYQNL